jgi:hypothetical protein
MCGTSLVLLQSLIFVDQNPSQAFKRLIVGVYFSYAEPGDVNPSWEALHYNPAQAVKPPTSFSNEELKMNEILRGQVITC